LAAPPDESYIYANSQKTLDDAVELQLKKEALEHRKKILEYNKNIYQNATANGQKLQMFYENLNDVNSNNKMIYTNVMHPPPIDVNTNHEQDDEFPPPPSPVSSSYSELRRATDSNCYATTILPPPINHQFRIGNASNNQHVKNNTYSNDYGIYVPSSQNSTTYESIYEPINPRPPSQMSSRSNYSLYAPYVEGMCSSSSSMNRLPIISQETEVDALTDLLVQSMHNQNNPDPESYGTCFKCNRMVDEASGCTAMEKVYHISCFTCFQCQKSLQGKPFYALDGKPFCEDDYLNTLEKCSVCMTPITERILRATGKPYHPHCFTCVVCSKSLDGIPFTVDATNKIHCIEDFHK
jgi:lipoma-prefererred partner